jgi:iron(III) transport system substrate-binding protein
MTKFHSQTEIVMTASVVSRSWVQVVRLIAAIGLIVSCTFGGMTTAVSANEARVRTDVSGPMVFYLDWPLEESQRIVNDFMKSHPLVKVDIVRADSNAISQRFIAEYDRGIRTASLLKNFSTIMDRWNADGRLLAYRSPAVGAALHPRYFKNNYYAVGLGMEGICYNTNLVKEKWTNWESILDPKYKGRIISQTMGTLGGAKIALITLRNYWGDARWEKFYGGLSEQKMAFAPSYIEAQNKVISGEYAILPICYHHFVTGPIKNGAPIAWVGFDPVITIAGTVGIASNAPNPEAAKAFIDWMLTPAGQTSIVNNLGLAPLIDGVKYPELVSNYRNVPQLFSPDDWYLNEVAKNLPFYDQKILNWFGRQ